MDEVLKQRLIGAALVIALAIIFVPMLFDEPADPRLERTMDPDMPQSPMANQEIRRLPLNPEVTRLSDDETDQREELDSLSDPVNIPESVIDVEPEARADNVVAEETEAERVPITEASSVAASQTPAPSASEESTETPTRSSSTETIEVAGPDWPSVWRVQVASFGVLETAESVVSDLEAVGYRAYIERIVRGESELFRINTGPFPDELAAEAARAEIDAAIRGVAPVVRSPSGADTEAISPGFAVQVGSFTNPDNAERLKNQLQSAGFSVFSFDEPVGERTIWRVRVGTVETREEAEALLIRLREDANLQGIVVSQP